jgi:hypothetical protein
MVQVEYIGDSKEFEDILSYFEDGVWTSIDCGHGWGDIVRRCHNELFLKDPNYRIAQIKEKFGALRFYFTPSDMELYREMGSIVLKYEVEASNTCEICGTEGYVSTNDRAMRARCEEHRGEIDIPIPTFQDKDDSLPLQDLEQ